MTPLIDPAQLCPLLGPLAVRLDVDCLAECTSTNDVLGTRAAQGAAAGTVIVADRQSAGRGRRGRQWASSPADSLTFSLLWRFGRGADGLPSVPLSGLSLAVGLGLVRGLLALDPALRGQIGLKWPNDLLLGTPDTATGKLGGILVELSSDRKGTQAIIGVGINLQAPPPEALVTTDTEGAAAPSSLRPAGLAQAMSTPPSRTALLATLLRGLVTVLDEFSQQGFAPLRADWEAHHLWQHQPVALFNDGIEQGSGLCRGVDNDGALLIETGNGLQTLLAGDLSLRALSTPPQAGAGA